MKFGLFDSVVLSRRVEKWCDQRNINRKGCGRKWSWPDFMYYPCMFLGVIGGKAEEPSLQRPCWDWNPVSGTLKEKDVGGSGRGLILYTVPVCSWEWWRKSRRTLITASLLRFKPGQRNIKKKDVGGSGRGLILCTLPVCSWEWWRKSRRTLITASLLRFKPGQRNINRKGCGRMWSWPDFMYYPCMFLGVMGKAEPSLQRPCWDSNPAHHSFIA